MANRKKTVERPVGEPVNPLPPGLAPDRRPLFGRWVRLEAVSVSKHAFDLYESFAHSDPGETIWTYLGYGPFPSYEVFRTWLEGREASRDPWFYAFVPRSSGT